MQKKVLVQQARDYFSQTISTNELVLNSYSSNLLLYKTAQGEVRVEVIFNSEHLDVAKAHGGLVWGGCTNHQLSSWTDL